MVPFPLNCRNIFTHDYIDYIKPVYIEKYNITEKNYPHIHNEMRNYLKL